MMIWAELSVLKERKLKTVFGKAKGIHRSKQDHFSKFNFIVLDFK